MEERKVFRKIIIRRESNHMSAIAFLSLLGSLFAGYLSYKKFFAGTCALTEGCSYFLGQPTCFYGFVLFFLIFIMAFTSMVSRGHFSSAIRLFSVVGVLFSGYFALYELFFAPLNLLNGAVFALLLPSCVYGLVLFLVIWILN